MLSEGDYVRKCTKNTNDEAKCQLLGFALYGKLNYVGKSERNPRINNIYAIKKIIREEELQKLHNEEDNTWIPEDANDKFLESQFERNNYGKVIEPDSDTIRITDYAEEEEKYPDVICDKPNTVLRRGKCICHRDHPYGDPVKTGCWGCSIPCASGATCISQDFCRCPNFYVGDGIRNCTMHTPVVLSVKGSVSDATVVVIIEDVPWTVPYPVYCRIGYDITDGTLMSRNRIECKSLAILHSKSIVSVSWDKNTWSKEEPRLEFDNMPWIMTIPQFAAILAVTFVMSCFCFRYYRKISDINYQEADLFELAFELYFD